MKGDLIIHNLISKTSIFLKRNGSTILSVAAAVGVVATSIAVYNATMDSIEIVKEKEDEKDDLLTDKELFVTIAPKYILPVALGAGTIACIFGANVLNKQQQAALTSAYLLLDSNFKKYKEKVEELYGKDANNQIRNSIAKDDFVKCDIVPSGETRLFYEPIMGKYFESSIEDVLSAEYHFNRNFILRGYSFLNEFYEFLHIGHTGYGDTVGWSVFAEEEYGYKWVDFEHNVVELEDGLECIVIEMPFGPHIDFMEY